jgi:hypothetical protein
VTAERKGRQWCVDRAAWRRVGWLRAVRTLARRRLRRRWRRLRWAHMRADAHGRGAAIGVEQPGVGRIRPEVELLLCCARTHLEAEHVGCIQALARGQVDWDRVLDLAHRHGVTPLLYHSLSASPPEGMPTKALARLQRRFQANALRNVTMARELVRLIHLLEAHGLPAVPFKGPALAVSAYGDLTSRQFGDLDLLIHRQDVQQVRALLLANGYRLQQMTDAELAARIRSWYCLHFYHQEYKIALDLHWRLRPRGYGFRLDGGPIWERLAPVSLAGARVLTFSPEDCLLFLCLHGSAHHWRSLKQVCDVAEVTRATGRLDWEQVIHEAQRTGCARRLSLGLLLAVELLDAPLPQDIRRWAGTDGRAVSLTARYSRQFCEEQGYRGGLAQALTAGVQMRERVRDRAAYCLFSLFLGKHNLARTLFRLVHKHRARLLNPLSWLDVDLA